MSSKQLTPNSVETLQTKIRFKLQSYQGLSVPSQKLAHPNYSIQPTGRISFSTCLFLNQMSIMSIMLDNVVLTLYNQATSNIATLDSQCFI